MPFLKLKKGSYASRKVMKVTLVRPDWVKDPECPVYRIKREILGPRELEKREREVRERAAARLRGASSNY